LDGIKQECCCCCCCFLSERGVYGLFSSFFSSFLFSRL
jgi:hypothetical protein